MRRIGFALLLLAALPAAATERSTMDLKPVALMTSHFYEGNLRGPRGVFFDRKRGELWVADTGNDLLSVFTPEAQELFACRTSAVHEPIRVVVDAKGRVLVLGGDRSKIQAFNARGEYLSDLELSGIGKTAVFGTIAIDADNNLYVGDNDSGQVFVYDKEMKLKLKFGERGSGQGEFQSVSGIAADAENIVVVDQQISPAVQVFDRHGNFVRGWGRHDMGIDNFSLPAGVALDAHGRIIVVDELRHEIKLFDREGKFIDRFGGLGKRLGQVAFPSDVAVDSDGRIYVAEKGNDRVQVFEEIGDVAVEPKQP